MSIERLEIDSTYALQKADFDSLLARLHKEDFQRMGLLAI